MTSLIDVIFLLLLFFMLTSTFTRYSELRLFAAAPGGAVPPGTPPLFLSLGAEVLRLNGETVALGDLGAALSRAEAPGRLLVAVADGVTSQRLVDVLVVLGAQPELSVTVMD